MAGDTDHWEIYKDKRNKFRWRRVARTRNRDVFGSACEGYTRKTDCEKNAQRHGMDGNPEKLGKADIWNIYSDKRGHFRWRRMAQSGEVTGASSTGFPDYETALANAKRNGYRESAKK